MSNSHRQCGCRARSRHQPGAPGRLSAIEGLLRAADSADPANHLQLGKLYARQGQTDMARAEFRRATALAPDRVEPRFELATSLQLADSHALALAQYDTIMRLAPDNAAAHHNFAVCLYNLGRIEEARTELEAARRLGGPVNPRFDSLLNPSWPPLTR